MNKSMAMMLVAAVLVSWNAFAGDVDTKTVVLENLSTNATAAAVNLSGQLGMIKIEPSITGETNDAVNVTITESFTGETVYAATGLTNSVVLTPARVLTDSAGAEVTFDGTNEVYAPFMVAGLNVSVTTDSTNAPSVAVKIIYDKKR